MKMIVSGAVAAILLGVIAAVALRSVQEPSYAVYSTSSARVGDPGSNLVGENWTGNPKPSSERS
jgi:hypothetical protein